MSHKGAKIGKMRRWSFLKTVFTLGFSAFGGPQMHIPYFIKKLVDEKKYCDKQTILDVNAFCSILPGPSTTQTITALGFKLGGPRLAFLSLLAWVLPGAALMTIITISPAFLGTSHLRFLPAMVAAFLLYAVYSMLRLVRKDLINYIIFGLCGIAGYCIISPLVFPIGIALGGFLSARFGNRQFQVNNKPFGSIKLANLTLYMLIFITIGAMSLVLSRTSKTQVIGKPLVLFENTYRIGSLAFGGGNTLAAMAVDQYASPNQSSPRHRMDLTEFNIGLGLVQGMPGPNFNFAVYLNGIAMKNFGFGTNGQILGCLIGLVGIFLPGTLLIFFAFPVWDRLQTYPIIQRSLDGVFAASVGFVFSAAAIINVYFWKGHAVPAQNYFDYGIFLVALVCLLSRRIPSPLIVIGTILAGAFLPL